jgi:hypothetical protein
MMTDLVFSFLSCHFLSDPHTLTPSAIIQAVWRQCNVKKYDPSLLCTRISGLLSQANYFKKLFVFIL